MVYLAVAVVFFILFGLIAHLDEKRKDQQREIDSLYEFLSRQNDRLSVMQTDRDAMAKDGIRRCGESPQSGRWGG